MDVDRPHFRTTSTGSSTAATAATSELFICFTSRLSSTSSMKISKSLLSPGRAARDGGPVSLSSSLSRRLRTNGSLKGGQASPFFNTTGKKRGCAFENPEPSSPKVTCIGQVRVKTKKKVKQSRSLSKRRSGGDVRFRKIEQQSCADGDDKASGQQKQLLQQRYSDAGAPPPQECLPQRNQRWVHLPISICEALKTFGAEFSCLFPCRSSRSSTNESERKNTEKQNGNENGCGAVFARWLVSVNDGEEGKRREIELVVGGGDEKEEETERVSMRTSRRHVFDDIEVNGDSIELKGQGLEREEEAARVSICIPPKNALLLMRCRSDPMKMAALSDNRFNCDSAAAAAKNENEVIDEEEKEGGEEETMVDVLEQEVAVSEDNNDKNEITYVVEDELEIQGDEEELKISSEEMVEEKTEELRVEEKTEELIVEEETEELIVEEETEELDMLVPEGPEEALVEEGGSDDEEEDNESNMSSFEALLDQENAEEYEDCCPIQDEEESEEDAPICHLSPSTESDEEANDPPTLPQEPSALDDSNIEQKDPDLDTNEERNQATTDYENAEQEKLEQEQQPEKSQLTQAFVTSNADKGNKEREGPLLPECLMLMMCEPKLSMEVSKETWVCSTDFMKWLPERPRKAAKPGDQYPVKRRLSVDSKPKPNIGKHELQQPPRSSCSLPAAAAAASMATMLEQKLVNAVAYEPLVLTRCKSEPIRTAAAKLIPESCCWKNAVRKLEPHTLGVGAAGVGF